MQIYRRCRISLAYISCFRLRYGRSRMWKDCAVEGGKRERERERERGIVKNERCGNRSALLQVRPSESRFFRPCFRLARGYWGWTVQDRCREDTSCKYPFGFVYGRREAVARGGQRCLDRIAVQIRMRAVFLVSLPPWRSLRCHTHRSKGVP